MLLRDDPTPAEVREKMREIFERSEFRRSKSWIERVLHRPGADIGVLFIRVWEVVVHSIRHPLNCKWQ